MRVWYICHMFLTYKKFNLRVVETHVFYSLCFNRHLKRILYKRGWKKPYLVSSKIKRRPTPATSTTPRTRLTDLYNSDNFHQQYYNHKTPTCHDKSPTWTSKKIPAPPTTCSTITTMSQPAQRHISCCKAQKQTFLRFAPNPEACAGFEENYVGLPRLIRNADRHDRVINCKTNLLAFRQAV